jgi:hypothetical protein
MEEKKTVSNITNHTPFEKGSMKDRNCNPFSAFFFFWIIMMSASKKPRGKYQPMLLRRIDKDKSYISIEHKAKQGKDEAGMKSMTMKSCSLSYQYSTNPH